MRSPRAVVAAAGLALALSACSGGDTGGAAAAASSSAPESAAALDAAPAPEGPFGPGCSGVPRSGGGSFADMATAPVVLAAGRNPQLTAFVDAVRAAQLVDSLNSQQDITVLLPANVAFTALPADGRQALMADTARLTALLTHHVVQGRLGPAQLAGAHPTLNNDEVTIEGSGAAFTIPATATVLKKPATVLCGNMQTANATIYVIDQVLAPPQA